MSAMLKYNLYLGHDFSWDKLAEENHLSVDELKGYLSGRNSDISTYNRLIHCIQTQYILAKPLNFQSSYRPEASRNRLNKLASLTIFTKREERTTDHQYHLLVISNSLRLNQIQAQFSLDTSSKAETKNSVKVITISKTVN